MDIFENGVRTWYSGCRAIMEKQRNQGKNTTFGDLVLDSMKDLLDDEEYLTILKEARLQKIVEFLDNLNNESLETIGIDLKVISPTESYSNSTLKTGIANIIYNYLF